jgi:hypothetical protein
LSIWINKLLTAAGFCRCVEQINKANRGDISQEDLQEKQVNLLIHFGVLLMLGILKIQYC